MFEKKKKKNPMRIKRWMEGMGRRIEFDPYLAPMLSMRDVFALGSRVIPLAPRVGLISIHFRPPIASTVLHP